MARLNNEVYVLCLTSPFLNSVLTENLKSILDAFQYRGEDKDYMFLFVCI